MNSIKQTARITGALYLIIAIAMGFSFTAAFSSLIVPGDATATANNIMASESLFRIGFVGDSVTFLSEIVLVVMLYVLFKPVSKTLSLVAASFRLAMTVMQGTNLLNKVTVLLLLGGGSLSTTKSNQGSNVFSNSRLSSGGLFLLFHSLREVKASEGWVLQKCKKKHASRIVQSFLMPRSMPFNMVWIHGGVSPL